ncbi:MAG: carboxypeptidase-like regulatory domain-containing protein [Bacteroidota bacterium]
MSKKNKSYEVADIQRYLAGGMSNAEMREMEMAALEDPFLQDAIDGFSEAYSQYDKTVVNTALKTVTTFEPAELREKKDAVVVPIWRRKLVQYAVAASILAGSGWFIFSTIQNTSRVNENGASYISLVKADTIISGRLPQSQPLPMEKTDQIVAVNSKKLPQKVEERLNKEERTTSTTSNAILKREENSDTQDDNDSFEFLTDQKTIAGKTTDLPTPAPAPQISRASPLSSLQKGEILNNVNTSAKWSISGKIVDPEKYPLDNITVQVSGSKNSVVSDELGRFEITLPDSNVSLVASGVGFKTKEFKATGSNEKIELQLEPSAANLSEIVMSRYATKRKVVDTNRRDIDTSDASPEGGWENFETYILTNKKVKSRGKVPVMVVLTFEVNKLGRPGEFDIINSGGDSYDNEAIRLMLAGPSWKNKTSDSTAMAKITLIF